MKCHACGVEKDPIALEVYPWPEEGAITDEPIPPFFDLDVSPKSPGDPAGYVSVDLRYRTCSVCHGCFHRLRPDMWTCRRHYESLNPVTPFADLPLFVPRSQKQNGEKK